jgi:hypothetical protein
MEDLVLDFRGPDGRATDSTLWLRNGGGKSSILNLLFAIVRPHKAEFLGGKAGAKQRSLADYVLPGNRAVAAAEWCLDPADNSLGFDSERFITGVFYERRDGSGDLRRLFFSCRVSPEHPESTIEELPLYAAGDGARARRTLAAFREAWRSLRDRAPHLGVGDTENQREWQEVLESARIDPELFSYQVRMNQREGGADELFRFADAEDFIDFLLALALDPALGDRVGRNITAFRRELLQRKEQLVPERALVAGLLSRMEVLREIRGRRNKIRTQLGEARERLENLKGGASVRLEELGHETQELNAQCARHEAAGEEHGRRASAKRARAAQLRRHAAELRLNRLKQEYEQAQEEWRAAQRLAKIWGAAIPLRRALQFEEKAKEQRRCLEQREGEHAPLRRDLEEAARRLASALTFRGQEHRKRADEARASEEAARKEARDYRGQANDAGKEETRAKTQAENLERRLAAVEAKQTLLIRDTLLGPEETADAAVNRWTSGVQSHADAAQQLGGEIEQADAAIEALEAAFIRASDVFRERQSRHEKLTERFNEAERERKAIERDAVLKGALELETVDADRLGVDTVQTLDRAARNAQRVAVQTRLAVAGEERAALHLEEHGLLPPSPDAQRVLDFLKHRLGGQAWSGWSWIEANVPNADAREAVRKAPSLAQGVVVRPEDLERAVELLCAAGLEPEGPLLVAGTGALPRVTALPGTVMGPKESAWFDRNVAQQRLLEFRNRIEEGRRRIASADAQHRDLTRCCETFRAFRNRYPCGWFEKTGREIQDALAGVEEARNQVADLQRGRREKLAERKTLDEQRRTEEKAVEVTRAALHRVTEFLEEHAQPSVKWSAELVDERRRARQAAQDARQWGDLVDAAEQRAEEASATAQRHAEEARALERECLGLEYVHGVVSACAGPLDELRGRYNVLRGQYEAKVGADALLALAKQNDENAGEERVRFAKLLSGEVTEEVVRQELADLPEPDTVEQLREDAEARASSLLGRVGNLGARIESETKTLKQAEEACKELPPLPHAPSSPDLAEAEASTLEGEASDLERKSDSKQSLADELKRRIGDVVRRRHELDREGQRLRSLSEDYADLLAAGSSPSTSGPPSAFEEATLPTRIDALGDELRGARGGWQTLDAERGSATAALRAFATAPEFERLDASWCRRIQEHDEPALEDASERLCSQLELRRTVLEDQISGVDRHRTVLVDELHAVAEEGMKLLRQASNLSKLPEHMPGIGGAHFLRIRTQEPEDPSERRARLAELIDELLEGDRELGGVALVQAAVRRLARPVHVRVLHPDPALDRRTVTIADMARSSGGEQLTGAILLYCTLARVRARSRGSSRRASGVLILDNPIGRASRVRFLELQRDVARAMGVQLIYTTGVNDHEALRALPNIIRLRNERVDRNSGRRLVEHEPEEVGVVEAVRIGRRESAAPAPSERSVS